MYRPVLSQHDSLNSTTEIPTLLIAAWVAVTALGCAGTPQAPALATGSAASVTADGLHKVDNPRFDLAFVKPGADLHRFSKVMFSSTTISYKSTGAEHTTSRESFTLSEEKMDRMQRMFNEVFAKALSKSAVYELVTAPGTDVLSVTAGIVDLVVNVPRQSTQQGKEFIASPGSMTLVLELSDSRSREVLVRVADRRAVQRGGGGGYRSSAASNWGELNTLFKSWALQLRRRLDSVRELPSLPPAPAE